MPELRDNPGEWDDKFRPAPSHFDRAAYQRKLDEICGTARGHSIIRVVWGAEEEMDAVVQYTSHGTAAETRRTGRHRTRVKGVPGKVRKRRWIFEEWQAPEQIADPGYVRLPEAGGLYVPPSIVKEKRQGKWIELYVVADHSKCKKEDCDSFEYFCFGDYREPDESDLVKFRRLTRKRSELERVDPFTPVSQKKINLWNKQAMDALEERDRAEEENSNAYRRDVQDTLSRVTTNG